MFPNYTGPYLSNGKFQSSVEFGEAVPKNALDANSRLHDTAYARYAHASHRSASDRIYAREARKIGGFMAKVAGDAVLYGNGVMRLFSEGSFDNCGDIPCSSIEEEVLRLYRTDPMSNYKPNMGGVSSGHVGENMFPGTTFNPYAVSGLNARSSSGTSLPSLRGAQVFGDPATTGVMPGIVEEPSAPVDIVAGQPTTNFDVPKTALPIKTAAGSAPAGIVQSKPVLNLPVVVAPAKTSGVVYNPTINQNPDHAFFRRNALIEKSDGNFALGRRLKRRKRKNGRLPNLFDTGKIYSC